MTAERDYRVRYTAVANFGKFLAQLKKVERDLDRLNEKSSKGQQRATDSTDRQTDALKDQEKQTTKSTKTNNDWASSLRKMGVSLDSITAKQKQQRQELERTARISKASNAERVKDERETVSVQRSTLEESLRHLQRYSKNIADLNRQRIREQKAAAREESATLRKSIADFKAQAKSRAAINAQRQNASDGDPPKTSNRETSGGVSGFRKLARGITALAGTALVGIAFSLQAIISALAAAAGAAAVLGNSLAQLAGNAAAIPGALFAIGSGAAAVKIAMTGIGDTFKFWSDQQPPTSWADALSRLAPSAQKFLTGIRGLKPELDNLKRSVQQNFFAQLSGSLGDVSKLVPVFSNVLTKASSAMGKVAADGIKMLASGPWQESFAKLADSNVKVIGSLGKAFLSLADGFRKIAVAAIPLTEFLSNAVAGLADDFSNWADTLSEGSFDTAQTRFTQFVSIIKSFGSIVSSVFKAAGDTTDWLMSRFTDVADSWANTVKASSQDGGKLKKYFDDLKPVLSETGKLFGDLFRGLAKLVDLPALAGTIAQIRTELLPAILELVKVLGSPENLAGLVSTITTLVTAGKNLLESGLLQFLNNLVTVVGYVAGAFNAVASVPILGDLVKFVGTLSSFALIGALVFKQGLRIAKTFGAIGSAAKKAAVAVGLLKAVETVGDAAGAAGKTSAFSKFLAGLPALAGTAAGTVGIIATGIAALATAITVGAVKLNDWYTANQINAKSSAQWSDELKQNAKDLQVVSKMKPPTQTTVPSGSNQAAPTTTTRFAQGTTSDDMAAYERAQKFKAELQDAVRVGDEGLKRLDTVLTSFGSSLDSEGFATFVDNVKALGLNSEQAAEKFPQLTSFLTQYGTNLEQFKTDPFTQARVGAQSFFDTLSKGTANAAVVEQAQARLSASQAKFNTAIAKGKYEQQAFYSTNAQGIPVLGAFGQAVTTQAQGIEKFYQQLLSSGVSADVAKAKYGQMTAQLYASLPAWAQNATEGQKLISVMKSASNTPIEIQIHEGKLRNTIADIDAQINRLSRKKATPEATLKIDELTAKKAQAEKELHDLEANEVDPNVKPKSLEEADEIISKLQKDKEILSQTTLVSVDGSAISAIESQLLNAISLKAQLSSGGGGRASGGETSATKIAGANGGIVPGQGDTDSVQALLMPGEFVIRKSAAKAIGYDNLEKLNQTKSKGSSGFVKRRTRYATGGIVGLAQRFKKGGRAAKSPSDLAFEAGYAIALNEAKARAKYSKMKPAQQRASDAREAGNEARTNREEALRRRDRELENQRRSIRDQIRAQQALVEAQEQARVAIEDMGKTVAQHNSGFTQRQASSELNSAKQNAKRVLADSNSTAVDREAARVELEAAQLRYDESLKQIEKDKADYAKLTAAGIEGSDGVIAARDSLTDFGFSLQDLAVSLREINAMIPTAEGGTLATPKGKAKKKSKPKGKRAMGGLIEGMQPYLVGEYGPEIVLPSQRGRVMTHAQTQKLVSPQFSFNPLPVMPKLSVPDAPRVKAQAGDVDNSRRFTIENQNINVHNPYRERSTDSIQRQLKKMTSREY